MSKSSEASSFDVLVSAAAYKETVSNTNDNDYSDFPKAEFEACHEIQAIGNPKTTRQMEGSSSAPNKEFQKSQVFIALRKMVAKKTAELKASPTENTYHGSNKNLQIVLYNPPEEADHDPNTMTPDIHPQAALVQAKPARTLTTLTGDILVSFELPDDFPNDVDVKALVSEGSQFSFDERLDGWRITRRQRIKGSFDMYYDHEKSKSKLRSIVEVVRFILYEEYPKPAANGRKLEREESAEKRKTKRKHSDVGCSRQNISEDNLQGFIFEPIHESRWLSLESREAMVIQFLNSAFENFKNLKFIAQNLRRVSKVAETKQANVPEKMEGTGVGLTPSHAVSPIIPSREGEILTIPSRELGQTNPVNQVEVSHGNPVQTGDNACSKPLEATEARAREIAYQSSHEPKAYMEECDMINHIPLCSSNELTLIKGKSRLCRDSPHVAA